MTEPGSRPPIPDLMVEKLALHELPQAQAQALRSRLDAEGDPRLSTIERSNAEILSELPPERIADQIERRLARLGADERPAPHRGWLVWAPVAVAASLALVWWIGGGRGPGSSSPDDGPAIIAQADPERTDDTASSVGVDPSAGRPETVYLKGDPQLMIDRIADRRPERMSSEVEVAAGDRLQLSYRAAGRAQGVIVSIDGAGVTTLHFPASSDASPRLGQGGAVPLSESYELDDAPGFERFFFVTRADAEPPLDVAQVLEAARRVAAGDQARTAELVLPEGCRQQSIVLRKGE